MSNFLGNQTSFVQNQPPTLRKSAADFGETSHRLWENEPPTLGKSATDFGKIGHQLWENRQPTSGKSATDFKEICHPFWCHRLWGKTGSVLGKHWLGFGEKLARFGGKWGNCFGF